jgi:hypothetical protein
MSPGSKLLKDEIKQWLKDHPLDQNAELDVHGVPIPLFDLVADDHRLTQLNRQIKSLTLPQQKLLLYLSRDIEPALIIESMEYASPELFWLDKALLVKEVDPTARQQDVRQVFQITEQLLDEIFQVADELDQETEKKKNRKFRKWLVFSAPVVLLFAVLFLYPVLIKPDPVALYDSFKGAYRPDTDSVDTIGYAGAAYADALYLLEEGNFNEAAKLFAEVIPADSSLRTASRWFLALISIRNGDKPGCNEQLRIIRNDDPDFYRNVAEKLYRKVNR